MLKITTKSSDVGYLPPLWRHASLLNDGSCSFTVTCYGQLLTTDIGRTISTSHCHRHPRAHHHRLCRRRQMTWWSERRVKMFVMLRHSRCISYMKTASNGNICRVTGPLCGEFNGHRWIPRTKASDAELWCFLWSRTRINAWVSNREAADLRRHRAHSDVIVMQLPYLFCLSNKISD